MNQLSFQEKSLWIVLLAMISVFALYYVRLTPPIDGNISGQDITQFIVYVVMLIVLAIVAHVILASKNKTHREQLESESFVDERQKMIELKGNAIGGHILHIGVFVSIGLGFWKPGNYWVIQGLIMSILISEVINIGLQLYYHRRGF